MSSNLATHEGCSVVAGRHHNDSHNHDRWGDCRGRSVWHTSPRRNRAHDTHLHPIGRAAEVPTRWSQAPHFIGVGPNGYWVTTNWGCWINDGQVGSGTATTVVALRCALR
jgi:hypothetical protein